jgi:hypothetical protein
MPEENRKYEEYFAVAKAARTLNRVESTEYARRQINSF